MPSSINMTVLPAIFGNGLPSRSTSTRREISRFCSSTILLRDCSEILSAIESNMNVLPSSAIAPKPASRLTGSGSLRVTTNEKSAFKYFATSYPTSTPPLGMAKTNTPWSLYFFSASANLLPASRLSLNIIALLFHICHPERAAGAVSGSPCSMLITNDTNLTGMPLSDIIQTNHSRLSSD